MPLHINIEGSLKNTVPAMEVIRQQMTVVSDEIATLKNELVALKGAHAALHQSSVESGQNNAANFGDQSNRIDMIMKKVDDIKVTADRGGKPKALMEAKQIEVAKFAGSMTDSRAKFLAWGESVRDRVDLFDASLGDLMLRAEKHPDVITGDVSIQ